jgi:uroporphyrinogen-III synthase
MPSDEPGAGGAGLPLAGTRVVVTRAEHQAGELSDAFAAAGAAVESLALLEVVPPADPAPLARAAAEAGQFDWILFTSGNAVQALARIADLGSGKPRLAAVGAATAAALRALGAEPALVAAAGEERASGLLAAVLRHLDCGQRVLLPQAADALPTLRDGLLAAGVLAVAVVAYDKRLPAGAAARAARIFAQDPLGWVTFTSPSTVRHFAALFGEQWPRRRGGLRAASIGPVTSAELARQGVAPAAVAEATAAGSPALVAAVVAAVSAARGAGG